MQNGVTEEQGSLSGVLPAMPNEKLETVYSDDACEEDVWSRDILVAEVHGNSSGVLATAPNAKLEAVYSDDACEEDVWTRGILGKRNSGPLGLARVLAAARHAA